MKEQPSAPIWLASTGEMVATTAPGAINAKLNASLTSVFRTLFLSDNPPGRLPPGTKCSPADCVALAAEHLEIHQYGSHSRAEVLPQLNVQPSPHSHNHVDLVRLE